MAPFAARAPALTCGPSPGGGPRGLVRAGAPVARQGLRTSGSTEDCCASTSAGRSPWRRSCCIARQELVEVHAADKPTPASLDGPELPGADEVVHQFPADSERDGYLVGAERKPGLANVGGCACEIVVSHKAALESALRPAVLPLRFLPGSASPSGR